MREGLRWASKEGFLTASHQEVETAAKWSELLLQARKTSLYDIDGLVLVPPSQVFDYDTADRPKWTTAYKVNDDEGAVEVTVLEIIEQVSRTNRISPKIKITPTKIKGVVVQYATAHNAQWMKDRGIGVGAVVKLVRSGDVIPKIEAVVKKAKKPWVPSMPYKQVGVHYVTIERHEDADIREILHFFTTLGIEHIAKKTVARLYANGVHSVLDHLNANATRMSVYSDAGIGSAMILKIYGEFKRVLQDEGVSLLKLMNASNCFESFGERKLQAIVDHYAKKGDRNMLKWFVQQPVAWLEDEVNWADIKAIKGMGDASARQFFEGVVKFKAWFLPILKTKLVKINHPEATRDKPKTKGKLSGQRVSWTGYRDKEQEAAVEAAGGEVVDFGSRTQVLLFKEGGKASSKIDKARDKGILVTTFKELMK
jgi:NAD-dependent DNA ligase